MNFDDMMMVAYLQLIDNSFMLIAELYMSCGVTSYSTTAPFVNVVL